MKNILLPTDFSKNSINAIRYALAFFKNTETNFFVLNIQKTSNYTTSELMSTSGTSSVYEAVLDDNKKALQELTKKLKKEYASEKYSFKALLDFDVFTDAMKQAVSSNKIDMIIMGTNGATGAEEVIFGSNTLKVIRQVDCPLITVPEGYEFKKIESVLFSTNHKKFPFSKLKPLTETLVIHNAVLKVLDIEEKSSEVSTTEIESFLESIPESINYTIDTIVGITPFDAINAFEQLFPVELHAMFVEKQSFLDRFIFGSKTSKINYNSKVPMLIMHY